MFFVKYSKSKAKKKEKVHLSLNPKRLIPCRVRMGVYAIEECVCTCLHLFCLTGGKNKLPPLNGYSYLTVAFVLQLAAFSL